MTPEISAGFWIGREVEFPLAPRMNRNRKSSGQNRQDSRSLVELFRRGQECDVVFNPLPIRIGECGLAERF